MRTNSACLVAVAIIATLFSGLTSADTLVLKDGKTVEGRVIAYEDDVVTFELRLQGVSLRKRYAKSSIAFVERKKLEGPGYCPLPIIGVIGRNFNSDSYVTASAFRDALARVRQTNSTYVVLVIDSPGGSVEDAEQIVSAIIETHDLEFIAYVRGQALSAAAIIAMACPQIYMAPDAVIGAAVPYQVTPDGTPENIDEKFRSAIRARFLAAARHGGHSPLLIRGMMETEIELAVIEQDNEPVIIEANANTEGLIIKPRGQIMTLTADQALTYGLADALTDSEEEIQTSLGLDAWHQVDDAAWYTITNRSRAEKIRHENAERELARQIAEDRARQERFAAREAQIDRILPTVSQIEQRQAQLHGEIEASDVAMRELEMQKQHQLDELERERQQSWNDALISDDPVYWTREVNSRYQRQNSIIHAEYDAAVTEIRRIRNAASIEMQELTRLHRDLVRSVPPVE